MDSNTNPASLVKKSIEQLPDQCEQAWGETQAVQFPQNYSEIDEIVVCGMGGSGLPTHFIQSAFPTKKPLLLVNGYDIPAWADNETFVILSSYSGTTEETLSCAQQAHERKCLVAGVTSGGVLGEWLKTNNYPGYVFTPTHNPAGQPRLGIGYGVFGQVGILNKLELLNSQNEAIPQEIARLRSVIEQVSARAHELATKVNNLGFIIFGADHLVGNAHICANQLNETAKTFSTWYALPEANHHLLEGLKHPENKPFMALFFESSLYDAKVQKRIVLTKQVVEKSGVSVLSFRPEAVTLVGQALETLTFSSWLSFHLSQLYNEDPVAIPWVDWFKEQLKKE